MWSLERPARGMAASQGGQLTKKARRGHGCLAGRTTHQKGPQGAWLPHREDNHRTNPQGAKLHRCEDTHQRPTGGNLACNGGARLENCITGRTPINGRGEGGGAKCLSWRSRCEKCITVRMPINGPQGAKMACNGGARLENCITGRTPINGRGEGGGGGGKMPVLEEQMWKMHHCEDAHQRPTGGKDGL